MSNISSTDLVALVCSRVCHDVVGCVGAISNGLEMLDEENDPSLREIADELVRKSAAQASARLTFSRLAFGAAGAAGSEISLEDARARASDVLAFERPDLDWQMPAGNRPKNEVKVLLNMVLIAMSAIPRGGMMKVSSPNDTGFQIECTGKNAKIPAASERFAQKIDSLEGVDAHTVQPVYTALLADENNLRVTFEAKDEAIVISASYG